MECGGLIGRGCVHNQNIHTLLTGCKHARVGRWLAQGQENEQLLHGIQPHVGIGEVTLHASPLIISNSFSEVGEAERGRDRNANDGESVEDDGRQTTAVSTTTDNDKKP